MTRSRLDIAAIALGVGAIVAGLLRFIPLRSDSLGTNVPVYYSTPASVSVTVLLILVALGGAAVVGGLLGGPAGRWLAVLAGAGMAAVAALIFVQNIADAQWLDGSRSSMALLGGLGIGLLAIGLTPRAEGPSHG